MALVCDAMRKMSSRLSARLASLSAMPKALWYTTLPLRATSATAPGIRPSRMACSQTASIRANRSGDTPAFCGATSRKAGDCRTEAV